MSEIPPLLKIIAEAMKIAYEATELKIGKLDKGELVAPTQKLPRFTSGGIVPRKTSPDEVTIKIPLEEYAFSKKQFYEVQKILGKSDKEIDELWGNI